MTRQEDDLFSLLPAAADPPDPTGRFDPARYEVRQIKSSTGKDFIRTHHYSRSCHNGPMCWGLYEGHTLIGVCAFATPNSENVRASVIGPEHVNRVTELHRLVILDCTPTNTESWFITKALAGLKEYRPNIWFVLSFADGSEGHEGTIYRATNALYQGTTGRARFWRDTEGRLRHPRQNGHNVTPAEAAERGWTGEMRDAKHRYLYVIGDGPKHRRYLRTLVSGLPYPPNVCV